MAPVARGRLGRYEVERLVEAIALLDRSDLAAKAFGAEVCDHLVNTARQEWARSNQVVIDWELARNFERI